MKFDIKSVNEYLRECDSFCEVRKVEHEGHVRYDVYWEDFMGDVGPEEQEYLIASYYLAADIDEENVLRSVVVHHTTTHAVLAMALRELVKHDQKQAQFLAHLAWPSLLARLRENVLRQDLQMPLNPDAEPIPAVTVTLLPPDEGQ